MIYIHTHIYIYIYIYKICIYETYININLKLYISKIMGIILVTGTLIGANNIILKSELPKYNITRGDPNNKIVSSSYESCPAVYPTNVDDYTWFTLIDSSANGYGMASSVTRPIDVNPDNNWLLAYRQFAGSGATHGQLGAAYSINSQDFQVQFL